MEGHEIPPPTPPLTDEEFSERIDFVKTYYKRKEDPNYSRMMFAAASCLNFIDLLHKADRKDMVICITVEGNIGVGKSTLMKKLKEDPILSSVANMVEEPFEDWENLLLEKDKLDTITIQQQIYAAQYRKKQDAMLKTHAQGLNFLIMEREPTSCDVFFESSNPSDLHRQTYTAYKTLFSTRSPTDPSYYDLFEGSLGYLYLRASTPFLMERIRQRGRACEATLTEDYISRVTKNFDNHYQKLRENGAFVMVYPLFENDEPIEEFDEESFLLGVRTALYQQITLFIIMLLRDKTQQPLQTCWVQKLLNPEKRKIHYSTWRDIDRST